MLHLVWYDYACILPGTILDKTVDLYFFSKNGELTRDKIKAISIAPDVEKYDVDKYAYDYLGQNHMIFFNEYDESEVNYIDAAYIRIEYWVNEKDGPSVKWYGTTTEIDKPVDGDNRKFIWVKEEENDTD